MKLVTVITSMIFAASLSVFAGNPANNKASILESNNPDAKPVAIQDVKVLEIEEPVEFDFDVKSYLPENFNPLKGKDDLDWSKIELIEVEDELIFDFNKKDYLPENFNPYACHME